jgi:hypothetical protein
MEACEVVTKNFLGPATYHVNITVIFQDFLDGRTIAHPVKVVPPKITSILADGPTTTGSFTSKRVNINFIIVARA